LKRFSLGNYRFVIFLNRSHFFGRASLEIDEESSQTLKGAIAEISKFEKKSFFPLFSAVQETSQTVHHQRPGDAVRHSGNLHFIFAPLLESTFSYTDTDTDIDTDTDSNTVTYNDMDTNTDTDTEPILMAKLKRIRIPMLMLYRGY
jgi:hypothetical protein